MTSKDRQGKTRNLVNVIYGAQQKVLREHAGVSVTQLATSVGYSDDQIRKIERGERRAHEEYIAATDACLGVNGALVATAAELRKSQLIPEWFAEYVELEAAARRIDEFDAMVIPGLLQTEEYLHAVLAAHFPHMEEDEISAHVRGRLDRQALLSRKPACQLSFVIEESALLRPVLEPESMRMQFEHLADCARMRNVTVQILPMDCRSHAGFDGPFTLLETGEGKRVAYVEYQGGARWFAESLDVSAMEGRYGIIRMQALNAEDSLRLIEKLAGEL